MTLAQRIRVPSGLLFALLFLWRADPAPPWLAAGLALAAAGLGLRLWAAGHICKHESLAVSGPYRWTRNPLYLGSFLMGLGFTVAASNPGLLVLFLALFPLVYVPVIREEERELRRAYGADFERYRAAVPLFFPRPSLNYLGSNPPLPGESSNFHWRRVVINREYNAVLGFLILSAFLLIRWLWR